MKAKNKSLGYILAMAIMFVVIAGSIGLATWAMIRTKLDVGGNISFTGTGDIEATISKGQLGKSDGSLSYVTGKMTGFDIASGYSESGNQATLDTWKNINISFDEDGLDIAICFKITNNSTTKNLKVTSPNATGSATNMTYVLTAMGRRADSIVIGHEEANKTVEFEIIFQVPDNNNNANMTFNVTLNLENTEDAATESAITVSSGAVSAASTSIEGDVVIPMLYKGEVITKINSFANCTALTSFLMPSSVTSTGYGAFNGCQDSLFTISNNVKYLGNSCNPYQALIGPISTAITNCDINDKTKIIASFAFYGSSLTSIIIPASVTRIGLQAFYNCEELSSIMVESGNGRYYSNSNCIIEVNSKTLVAGCKNSVIPTDGSVTSIGDYAFSFATGLTSIIIPESVTSIGDYAISFCTALTSIIIPESVTSIGDYAIFSCTQLTELTIPSKVKSIGEYAFYGCSKLTNLTFAPRTESLQIGRNGFSPIITNINFNENIFTNTSDASEVYSNATKPADANALNNKTWKIS